MTSQYSQPPIATNYSGIEGAAFFVGKLNKNHDRDHIYNSLRTLTKKLGFYISKLDMPYGNPRTKRGNHGYCFVHCRSKAEADRVVRHGWITLAGQKCEVKAYGGRDMGDTKLAVSSQSSSGYATPINPKYMPQKSIEQDLERVLGRPLNERKREISSGDVCGSPPTEEDWAEEAEDATSYYSEAADFEQVDCKVPVEPMPQVESQENIKAPVAQVYEAQVPAQAGSTKTIEQLYETDNVSKYTMNMLEKAQANGSGDNFWNLYFQHFEKNVAILKGMSQDQLRLVAQVYAPALAAV